MDLTTLQVIGMNTSSTSAPNTSDPATKSNSGDPWRILLIELVNLLGLVLTHSRNSRGERATTVIFEQIIRRLHILDRMPGHPGSIIVRRIGPTAGETRKPDYRLTFGDQSFCRANALNREGQIHRPPLHLAGALDQAFESFHEQGIVSLFLQLPGDSSEKIDQLRLSLNLLARFRLAAENNASITFRYFGRAIRIPLIRDSRGKPDPNLTLVAGLNGLTAVNMREIVKQAVSFCKLSSNEVTDECSSDNYSKIFHVRGLRTQLIQPPLEINTMPWLREDDRGDSSEASHTTGEQSLTADEVTVGDRQSKDAFIDGAGGPGDPLARSSLATYGLSYDDINLGAHTDEQKMLESIFLFDSNTLDAETLAQHLALVNRILHAMAPGDEGFAKTRKFLDFLNDRLELLPDAVSTRMEMQRQGLKIESQGRKLIVGMVHPRLVELVTLVKDKKITRQKIAACRDYASIVLHTSDPVENKSDLVELWGQDAGAMLDCARESYKAGKGFQHSEIMECIERFGQQDNSLFEMMWAVFRNMPQEEALSHFQIALPLIAKALASPSDAVSFLLADLFINSHRVASSDRNAFALATLLLRTHHKEHTFDINQTPEEVLAVRKSLDSMSIAQASWRLDIDRSGVLSKFKTIRELLIAATADSSDNQATIGMAFESLLAVEREGLIFLALVGGGTALTVFREALDHYSNPRAVIYQGPPHYSHMYALMAHLQIILRGMARLGKPEDLNTLKAVEQSAARLMALDADPAYARRVKQALQWIAPAIRAIQVQLR